MDQTQLIEFARQMLLYLSPLIAAGALAKVGEDAVDATRELAWKTWALLQRVFDSHDESAAALTLYKARPEDRGRQQIVEGEIVARFEDNQAALDELAALVDRARALNLLPQQAAGRTHHQVITGSASVGAAITGDVHGAINVGAPQQRRRAEGDTEK